MGCSASQPAAAGGGSATTGTSSDGATHDANKSSARVAPAATGASGASRTSQPMGTDTTTSTSAREAWENVANPVQGVADSVTQSAAAAAQAAQQQALAAANRTKQQAQSQVDTAAAVAVRQVDNAVASAQATAATTANHAAGHVNNTVAAADAAATDAATDVVQAAENAANAVQDAVADETNDMQVMLTDRKVVNGQRCVVTIGQRTDGTGVMVRAFWPASEEQHELSLSHEQIRESLPEDILGDENELQQLNYIRDNLRLAGPPDAQYLELLPPGGPPVHVMLRDRRIIGGKMAHITIGMRDGFVVVRAFNPASEKERELELAPGQLHALMPTHLHGEENEIEQLHWISHNLHYVRARNGKVQLKLVPPESQHFIPELTADDDDVKGDEDEETAEDLSTVMLFRNQVRLDGKRVFVTIARRGRTLIVRALNPAAQHESELVLPSSTLAQLLPAHLLSDEAEVDMLKAIANDLCFKPSNDAGHVTLALRGQLANRLQRSESTREGAKVAEEAAERPDLQQLFRDRRTLGGVQVYLTVGRRAGELVVNVYSPSKQAEEEVALPLQRLMYVVPPDMLREELENDMVHYIADAVDVEATDSGIKVQIKGAPPAVPQGTADAVITESLRINGEDHTVTAERYGDVLVVMAYHLQQGASTTITVDLKSVRADLQTGTAKERAIIESGSDEDLVVYLLSRLEYVTVPCGTKLELAGITGPGAIVDRGFSQSVVGSDDNYYIVGLHRSASAKNLEVSAFNTESHATLSKKVPMDDVAGVLANDPDGAALMKEVKVQALFERLARHIDFVDGAITFNAAPRKPPAATATDASAAQAGTGGAAADSEAS